MQPTVSVVVPCYGQARFLDACIASLRAQTMSEWEAVIVDDGSPDDTQCVAAELVATDTRVRLVSKLNGGLASARNAGLTAATGEFVQFLDADDLIEPRKLEHHVEYLRQHAEIDVVFGNAWYFDDAKPQRRVRAGGASWWAQRDDWIARRARDPAPNVVKLLRRNQFPVCAPLVRRRATERVGGFDEELCLLEDWEFWLRCAAAGSRFEFRVSPETAALVRMHGTSMSVDKRLMMRAELALAMKALGYLSDPILRRRASVLAASGIESLDGDEWHRALAMVREAVADDMEATKMLQRFAWICGHLPAGSSSRRMAYRVLRAVS